MDFLVMKYLEGETLADPLRGGPLPLAKVVLEATIDPEGNVTSVRVVESIEALDLAAMDAVRQWKYEPALLEGVAVPIVMTITVNFTLD